MTTFIDIIPKYRGGDPAPKGYLEWHEWARVQLRAGLKQEPCPKCSRYKFPQEISSERIGNKRVCRECVTGGEG